MKVLITTPLYPPDIGGPATYAAGLEKALLSIGHVPVVLNYRDVLSLPSGIRQLVFAWRVFLNARNVDAIIALDTLSIGLPSVCVAKLLRIPGVLRVAGDQLWERYANRTQDPTPFPKFYDSLPKLNVTEKIMHTLTGVTFLLASRLVFSTNWQQKYRSLGYPGVERKSVRIENAYTHSLLKTTHDKTSSKIFIWAGRDIPLKNVEQLKLAFAEAQKRIPDISLQLLTNKTHEEILSQMKTAYAVVLPSYSEDSPNVILEGLSFGKPFISTSHNGLRELIEPFGLFVDPYDSVGLTDAIIKMSENDTYDSFERAIEKFHYKRTYDDIAKEFIRLIEQAQ